MMKNSIFSVLTISALFAMPIYADSAADCIPADKQSTMPQITEKTCYPNFFALSLSVKRTIFSPFALPLRGGSNVEDEAFNFIQRDGDVAGDGGVQGHVAVSYALKRDGKRAAVVEVQARIRHYGGCF